MPQSYSYKHQDFLIILNFTANSAVYTIKHKFSSDPHMFFCIGCYIVALVVSTKTVYMELTMFSLKITLSRDMSE